MTLRLRDTLTRRLQPLQPEASSGEIRMYSCGPTVYRYAHVGNLRTFLLADLIRRVVLYHGVPVRHVQNITDVGHLRDERFDRGEDRMLVSAGLENKTPSEIADAYEAAFHADAALINLLPAHVYPRATEHIDGMVALAEQLEDLGYAYATDARNVYYSVASFPGYGALSGNTLDALRAGHRGEVEADKRDPADFALWKAAGDGRLLKWPTPRWGEGFPGWHLECSAMALEHLGPRFDLHTGGEDNVFPHHEDEIAQSAPLVGGPPARLWVHGAHLLMSGRRMAKSAGNFQRITELVDDGIDPLAFRYLCLTARYSRRLDYSDASLAAAAASLDGLRERLRALGSPPTDGPWVAPEPLVAGAAGDRPEGEAAGIAGFGTGGPGPGLDDRAHAPAPPLSAEGAAAHERLAAAFDKDLDLPNAVATVWSILRSDLPADERRWLVLDADFVLGLDLHRVWEAPPAALAAWEPGIEARVRIEMREAARAAGDFALADQLRDELAGWGITLIDRADGTTEARRDA
ncbi:MAG TPA: cysteine--tRNA ligase [Candidatus Polarisedimenticolia bacterium]|nr:cysteine--tRNA ligase [Candidatus Polarisedimenticolia bacterium]